MIVNKKHPKDLKLTFPPEEIVIEEQEEGTATGYCRVPNGLVHKFYDLVEEEDDKAEDKDAEAFYALELVCAVFVVVSPAFFSDFKLKPKTDESKKAKPEKKGEKDKKVEKKSPQNNKESKSTGPAEAGSDTGTESPESGSEPGK